MSKWRFLLSRFFEISNLPVFDITFINGKLWLALYFIVAYEIKYYMAVCSFIVALFNLCYPPTVIRRIISIYVNSI